MDYMKELNSFRNWLLVNPLSTGEIALWHTLISINNMTGWIEWFTAPNTTVQLLTGLSKQGLDNSRNKLIQKGLISYRKGSKNAAGSYKMVTFERMVKKSAQIVDQILDQELDQGVDHFRDRDLTTLGTESGPGSRPLLDIDIDEDKDETSNKDNPPNPSGKVSKIKYADYIFLTTEEYAKLTELLGDQERERYFLEFAAWISGKKPAEQKSRSAYLTIRNWYNREQKKRGGTGNAVTGRHSENHLAGIDFGF